MKTNHIGKTALEYIFTLIKQFVKEGFVAKDGAKVLSDNNYTTAEKNKLAGIADNAQVNVIEEVQVNNVKVSPVGKLVNITVPTKTSDLNNDSNFLTSIPAEYVTDTELTGKGYQTAAQVNQLISASIGQMTGIEYSVVEQLPPTGLKGVIYLVAHSHGAKDIYDEFIWVTDKFEKIGNTDIDLSGYLKTADLVELTNSEIKSIWDKAQAV